MKDLKNKTENLTDHISDYVETYVKLSVLKATDKAAGVASVSITSIIIGVLAFFIMLCLTIGIGFWIGQQLDNNMLAGFGIVAGFYAVLVILLIALRQNVFLPFFKNFVIRLIYE